MNDLLTNRKNQDSVAIIEHGVEIPYSALIRKSRAVESVLTGREGSVAIFLPNGGDFIAAFWGGLAAGVRVMPVSTLFTAAEAAPLLRQADVGTVVTSSAYSATLDGIIAESPRPIDIVCMEELDSVPRRQPSSPRREATVLLGTSGTTGESKIVELSQRNLEVSAAGFLGKMIYTDKPRIRYYPAMPFCSAYGIMILAVCLSESFPIVVPEGSFSLNEMYRAAEKHKITHYEGGATVVQLMVSTAGREIPYDISSLKYIGFGGSGVSEQTLASFMRAYPGVDIYQGYGMTEAAPLIAKYPVGRLDKPRSAGVAIESMTIAIETEAGISTDPYITGEIVAQGPNVMMGYYKNPDETAKVIKNGWLHTGDIGYLDEDGYLYICGRLKNVVNVRGFSVYPEEVEACIQNSGLASACHVYGAADDSGAERVCARVVPVSARVSIDEIRQHCKDNLAPYKWPGEIIFCDAIQTTLSGKARRVGGE